MKKIAIIGAGISGLRAGAILAGSAKHSITFFEKSRSVGGRVATRRFESVSVNHGTETLGSLSSQTGALTNFPKSLRDELTKQAQVSFHFNKRVSSIVDHALEFDDGDKQVFDHVLITAPLPQVREMLKSEILPKISYHKMILMIGEENQKGVRIELPSDVVEECFESSDEVIRARAKSLFGKQMGHLDVKKWRYATVKSGVKQAFFAFNDFITVAGDAFDPKGEFGIEAAWMSGESAAKSILGLV